MIGERQADMPGRLLADSAEPMNLTQAEFRKLIHEDKKKWAEVAKQANIRVQ